MKAISTELAVHVIPHINTWILQRVAACRHCRRYLAVAQSSSLSYSILIALGIDSEVQGPGFGIQTSLQGGYYAPSQDEVVPATQY